MWYAYLNQPEILHLICNTNNTFYYAVTYLYIKKEFQLAHGGIEPAAFALLARRSNQLS